VNLNSLRGYAVRNRVRVSFPVAGGLICLVNEHGVAKVAGLNAPPQFNLESELSQADSFALEAVTGPKEKPQKTAISRSDLMAKLAAAGGGQTAGQDEHED